jgi:hypothetical protein
VSGVVGEVDDRVAELLFACVAEADGVHLAAGPGDGGDAGEGGEGLLVGEAGAEVADLGEQRGGTYAVAGFGEAGEDVRVGVRVEVFDDLGLQFAFLPPEGCDGAQQGQDAGGAAVGLDGAQPCGGRLLDAGVQLLDRGAAGVGDAPAERGQPSRGQPAGRVTGGVAAQKRDRDVAVQASEQADGAGGRPVPVRPAAG